MRRRGTLNVLAESSEDVSQILEAGGRWGGGEVRDRGDEVLRGRWGGQVGEVGGEDRYGREVGRIGTGRKD